eukprot:9030046-Pyramimonas_sp.AAC.1
MPQDSSRVLRPLQRDRGPRIALAEVKVVAILKQSGAWWPDGPLRGLSEAFQRPLRGRSQAS